ncbi:MAG TPA: RNA polymerase sigma factor [Geothrix sp.]|nr:RNA polymerase sigma factor [Geothrix sp.]
MDDAAFQACFEATRGPLLAYLARTSGDPALAEDLLQEAYVRLLNGPPREATLAALRSWLFTTATRLLRDHWRRGQRWRSWPWGPDAGDLEGPPEPSCPEPLPDRLAQDRQLVARGFAALSPRQRSLLWLCHVEGLDHVGAARALGLSPGSVRVLLHRARTRMADTLATLDALSS